jgi:gliding motility-associated-like protein
LPGRFAITSSPAVDPNGGFSQVATNGGLHSVRIGDQNVSNGAERIQYYLHVPAGANNYSFTFEYAVVYESPTGHPANVMPRFAVSAIDSATGLSLKNGCYDLNFIAGGGLPGFFTFSGGEYKPWSQAILNISGAAGSTVIVDVAVGDCGLGGHWGYGYFDVIDCGKFKAAVASCDLDGQGIILTGPLNYMSYQWYDQNWTLVDTGMVATIHPNSTTQQSYALVLTPYPSVSTCPDTIYTQPIANVDVQAQPDTSCITPNIPLQLNANATGGVGPLSYVWTEYNTPGNTLSCDSCQMPIATPVGTSFYTVKVSDTNGCYRTDTLQVYYSTFVPNAGNDFTTCVGTPVTFNGSVSPQSSALTYQWTPGAGLNFDTLLTPTFNPTAVGTYQFVLAVDSIACTKYDTMQVTVLPNDFTIHDTTICSGADSFRVNANGDTSFTYSWSPSIGVLNPTVVNPTIITDTSRTYVVTASYPTCPTIVKTFNVTVEPSPDVVLGADTTKCQWEDLFLVSHVTPAWYSNFTYQWTPANNLSSTTTPNVMFTGQQSDTLKLIVSTPGGCRDSDYIKIMVHPGNFASLTPSDTAICPNTPVNIAVTGGSTYQWIPSLYLSDSTSANVVSNAVSDINYTVYVKDTFGCSDTLTTSITIYSNATLDAGPNVTLYPGDTVQLNPTGNCLYYQWFPPQGLSASNVSNPMASPTANTRYYVTGTTEHGCVTVDSVDVTVSAESLLAMPNAFAPGNTSSPLKLVRRGDATLKHLRIFDRWGKCVFETSDIDEGWDGKYKGVPQPMGVYVYQVEAVTKAGAPYVKQGNITLIR